MKRSTLAAVAVMALGTLGLSAPAASAAPSHAHGPSAHAHGPSTHGTAKLTNAQKKVRTAIKVLDRKLAQNLAQANTTLGVDDAAAVAANIAADRAALADLGTQLTATTTTDEVRAIATQVAGFRAENYRLAVNGLNHVTGDDIATAALTDADVAAAVATATDLLRALTATSTRVDLTAARDALTALDALMAPEADETGTDEPLV